MPHHRVNIPSLIIREGMATALLNLHSITADVAHASDMFHLSDAISSLKPDILIINPTYLGITTPRKFIQSDMPIKFIALHNSTVSSAQLQIT